MSHSIPSKQNKEFGTPWIDTAQQEIGVREVPGPKANARILEYFKASKFWKKDDSPKSSAWCGSFAAWVAIKHGFTPPKNAYRALEWLNFGQRLDKPAYGALAIKTRDGGGHVAFLVGQSKDGSKYHALGGNQDNAVNVKEYSAKVWTGFVFPTGAIPSGELPIYGGTAEIAGSEG